MTDTPISYAAHLATYISDVSTIRARTLEQFGRAPTRDAIAKLRAGVMAEKERFRAAAEARASVPMRRLPKAAFDCGHENGMGNVAHRGEREVCLTCLRSQQAEPEPAGKAIFPAWYRPPSNEPAPVQTAPRRRICGETLQAVSDAFGISVGELIGDDRRRLFVDARAVAVRIFREQSGLSYSGIKTILHRDCHSTIRNLHLTWEKRLARNPQLASVYAAVAAPQAIQTERAA